MTRIESNIVLFSITLCWASSYIFIKNLPDTLSPFAYMTMTTGIASIILIIVFFRKLHKFSISTFTKSKLLALFICGNLVFERLGIKEIPASTASFVASLNIVIVPLIMLFFKKKPSKNNVLGIGFILSGLTLTSGIKIGQTVNSGIIYMFIACVFMAGYIIAADRFTKGYDPLILGIGQMFATFIIAFALWTIEEPRTFTTVQFTNEMLANIFLLAFFSKAYAYIMLMYSQKYANPLSVTVIASTEPIVTMVLVLLIPGTFGVNESFTLAKLVGAVLIAIGAFCAGTNFLEKREAKANA